MKVKITLISLLVSCAMSMSLWSQTSFSLNNKQRLSGNGGATQYAFDNDATTKYQSNGDEHAWVGLNLGTKHVITKVRWNNVGGTYAFNDDYNCAGWALGGGGHRVTLGYSQLAVFEGANEPDFSDAVPLYLVTETSTQSRWREANVVVTRGFQYVRYKGPAHSRCQVLDLEFLGYPSEGTDDQFYQPTNLPVVVVHTSETKDAYGKLIASAGVDPWDKVNDLNATFTFLSQEGTKILTDSKDGSFRLRGNSSLNFPKKPYRVKLGKKQNPFSSEASFKKWTLVPAIDDRSLMRNMIGYGINQKLGQEYTPYIRPVDLFVNGEYKGVYQFCDQVEANVDSKTNITRIDIEEIASTKDEAGNAVWPGSAMDFGWFIELDADDYANAEPWHFFSKNLNVPVTIKSPDEDEVPYATKAQYINEMQAHFDKMIVAAQQGKVEQYLDLPSFARHFIGCEFTGNTDAYRSMYMHKHVGDDKFYTGPLWDLNLAFNNDYRIGNLNTRTQWCYKGSEWSNVVGIRNLMEAIMSNPQVLNEVKSQWAQHRLYTDELLEEVDYWQGKLEASQKLNFMRWQNLNFRFFFQQQATGSWYDDVDYLRECLESRVLWMDKMLGVAQKCFNLTIKAGWSTLYLPIAFIVPKGLSVYEIEDVRDGVLQLVEVKSTQPNRPYLVKGQNGTYTLTGSNVEVVDGQTLGVLVGTSVDIAQAPVGSYVLQNQNGLVNFYRVGSVRPKIPAQKAYMMLPAGQQAPDRFYLDGEETGLDEMAMDEVDVTVRIYDMAGHLLEEIAEGQWSDEEVLSKYGRGMYVIRSGNTTRKVAYGY